MERNASDWGNRSVGCLGTNAFVVLVVSPSSYQRFYLYLQCNGSAKRLNCYVVSNKHKGATLIKLDVEE